MLWSVALAQQTLVLDGSVERGAGTFAFVPFDVPEGTAEIRVSHRSSTESVLDWGLIGPDGSTRGWGGGNEEDVVINDRAASRSYLTGLPSGTWQVAIGAARLEQEDNPFALSVTLLEQESLAPDPDRGPFVDPGVLRPGPGWFAGDLHVHSLQSGDANASLDAIADLARSQGLDFVVITDHNTNATVEFLTSAQARHPDVLFIPGMELTTYAGHFGLFGTTAYHDHGLQPGFSIADLVDDVHADGGLISANHPALDLGDLCIGCAMDHDLSGLQLDGVEIQTGGLEPVGGLFTDAAIAFWEARGQGVAAVGGSDDHRAGVDLGFTESPIGSPTTMVFAESLSIQAILDGIRNERTVVKLQDARDPMLTLDAVEGGIQVQTVGEGEVRLIRDGAVMDVVPAPGDAFVAVSPGLIRAELWNGGERRVVTSSTRVESTEAADPERSCGCRIAVAERRSWLAALLRR